MTECKFCDTVLNLNSTCDRSFSTIGNLFRYSDKEDFSSRHNCCLGCLATIVNVRGIALLDDRSHLITENFKNDGVTLVYAELAIVFIAHNIKKGKKIQAKLKSSQSNKCARLVCSLI
jgi:hypothetical protein